MTFLHDHPITFKEPLPACKPCGSTVCYVDDATYSFGSSDPAVLSNTLTTQYNLISKYMVSNKLVINDDKTNLVVMAKKNSEGSRQAVSLQAGEHTIQPLKLLGCQISKDLKWKEHILTNEASVIRQMTSRVNGLCLVSHRATFGTRLMIANGIVISRLCYLFQLWVGCVGYLLNSLQIIMNRAARSVTGYN